MLLFVLLLIKFILFLYFTKASYSPWLIYAVDLIILSGLLLLFRKREKPYKIASLIIYSLISILMFSDVVYFTYFNRLPSVNELGHAKNLGDVLDAVYLLIKLKNLIFILDIPVLIYLAIKDKLYKLDDIIKNKTKIYSSIPLILFCISFLVLFMGANKLDGIKDMELFTYHTRDLLGLQHKEDETEVTEDINEVVNNEEVETENEWTGIGKGKNLIIIQVESLNNFVINRKYLDQEITPCLNSLIKENGSIYASDYFEMLGAGNTSDAEFVSLHSLYPSMKNPSYEVYSTSYVYGLPKILKDMGYVNTAFHNYKRDFWIRDRAYPHIGFDRFIAEDNFDTTDKIGMGLSDKSFLRQCVPYIKEMKSPFFAFLVTLTSHIPYEMPESELKLKVKDEDKGSIFGNYMNAIHYTDAALGEFIDALKKEGIFDNSVIAIYGDHHALNGSNQDDNKRISDLTGINFDFDTMLNIPLIIHVGGTDKREEVDHVASQIDLAPTLLNILGIDRSKYVMFGHDIFSKNHPKVLFPQSYMLKGSYIDDDHIFNMGRDGIFENGVLKERKTGKKIENTVAKEKHKKALKEIQLCKQILEKDDIEALMSGGVKKTEGDLLARDIELTDAVIVNTKEEIEEAYRSGYNTFKLKLNKTNDGYFVARDRVSMMDFNRLPNSVITLGNLISGKYPDDMKFIIESDDMNDLITLFRSLPGLYTNIMLEVNDNKTYTYASNKQNGYKIIYHGRNQTKEELMSMAETNTELYFYDIHVPELDDITYHDTEGTHLIKNYKDIRISNQRTLVYKDDQSHMEIYEPTGLVSYDDLLIYEGRIPIAIKFNLNPQDENTSYAEIYGNKVLDTNNIQELLEQNKNLKLAIITDSFTIETLRNMLKNHPDMDRLIPILNGENQAPFAKRMGYDNYVLDMDKNYKEMEELRQIWGAKIIRYR